MDRHTSDTSLTRCRNCKRRVDDTAHFCHACAFPILRTPEKARRSGPSGVLGSIGSYIAGTLAAILVIVAALKMPLPGSHTPVPGYRFAHVQHHTAAHR